MKALVVWALLSAGPAWADRLGRAAESIPYSVVVDAQDFDDLLNAVRTGKNDMRGLRKEAADTASIAISWRAVAQTAQAHLFRAETRAAQSEADVATMGRRDGALPTTAPDWIAAVALLVGTALGWGAAWLRARHHYRAERWFGPA